MELTQFQWSSSEITWAKTKIAQWKWKGSRKLFSIIESIDLFFLPFPPPPPPWGGLEELSRHHQIMWEHVSRLIMLQGSHDLRLSCIVY